MQTQSKTQTKTASSSVLNSDRSGILQRKCTNCGQHTIASGKCLNCEPRGLNDQFPSPEPSHFMESNFEQDLSQIRVNNYTSLSWQPQLAINQPGDQYEQEADRIAQQILQTPRLNPQNQVQQQAKDQVIQTYRYSNAQPKLRQLPYISHQTLKFSGQPLHSGTRNFMESRFGYDFSQVRVHTDGKVAQLSQSLNAKAFTYGSNIYFNQGQYNPTSAEGTRLLAHELTHVVQQSNNIQPRIQRSLQGCANLLSNPTVASLISGNTVHRMIQAHFNSTVSGATNVFIPGASASPLRSQGICGDDSTIINPQIIGGMSGAGFPDLARITPGGILQVAEIKPAAIPCLIDGEEQLLRYINQGNARDTAQETWRTSLGVTVVSPMLTTAYQPPTFITSSGLEIRTAWCSAGLLAYAVSRRGRTVPVRERVRVPTDERRRERERLRETSGDRIGAVGGAAVATTVAVVAGRALWRHFWRAVAQRFALRGAVAAALAAADGPLPFGELIDLGLAVGTAIEIFVVWDDLWREADRIAAQEA